MSRPNLKRSRPRNLQGHLSRSFLGRNRPTLSVRTSENWGVAVERPELSINGFVDHAIEEIADREVSLPGIEDTVTNPLIVLLQSRGRHYYLSGKAAVVLNREGKVITIYPSSHFDETIRGILDHALRGANR